MFDRVGVVLAGGRSSRFGSDKFRHPVDGVEMGLRAVRCLSSCVDHVVVVGRHEVPDSFDATALFGAREGSGPLGALLDVADLVEGARLVVLPCDMPRMSTASMARLCRELEEGCWEAAFASSTTLSEPQWLAGCWQTGPLLDEVRRYYERGGRSVRDAAALLRHVLVDLPATELVNVNQLAEA